MTLQERAEALYGSAFYYGNLTKEEWLTILIRNFEQVREDERQACMRIADSISNHAWKVYKGRAVATDTLHRGCDITQGISDGAEEVRLQIEKQQGQPT